MNIYRENTFRVTGLSVDASEREIKKQAAKLKMLEELGQGEDAATHAYALRPAPSVDQIRAAIQRLKEPEHRLIDEFFWFWPKEFGKSDQDAAIQALQRGDDTVAHELWSNEAADPTTGYVAVHNLAILYHLVALDWTLEDLKATVDPEREAKIEQYWRTAFHYWEQVATHDDIWDALKARVQVLDDARLTTGFVRRMRNSLPGAFDKINAEAALRFAEADRMDWAQKHIDFMNETHQGLDDVEKTALLVLTPTRKRVKQLIQSAKDTLGADANKGLSAAERLTETCHPLLKLFELFHGKESHHKTELFDEVAETINSCCVGYGNSTGRLSASNEALRKALVFATSVSLRQRIEKNLEIGEGSVRNEALQPVYAELSAIQESKDSPAARLSKIKTQILPFVAQFMEKEGTDDDRIPGLLDSTAIVLRGISIDAFNDSKDTKTALDAIKLAIRLAKDPERKKQIAEDLRVLNEMAGESECFYCGGRPAEPKRAVGVNMFGDVQRNAGMNALVQAMQQGRQPTEAELQGAFSNAGTINYRHTTVKIPRCGECYRVQLYLDIAAISAGVLGLFLTIQTGPIFGNGAFSFFLAGATGVGAALIGKLLIFGSKRSEYPRIKDLISKGWSFGTKPSS